MTLEFTHTSAVNSFTLLHYYGYCLDILTSSPPPPPPPQKQDSKNNFSLPTMINRQIMTRLPNGLYIDEMDPQQMTPSCKITITLPKTGL